MKKKGESDDEDIFENNEEEEEEEAYRAGIHFRLDQEDRDTDINAEGGENVEENNAQNGVFSSSVLSIPNEQNSRILL